MVGHSVEVERSVKLQVESAGMADRVALGKPVRLVRCAGGAEQERVERIVGVDVQVAEVRVLGCHRRWRKTEACQNN